MNRQKFIFQVIVIVLLCLILEAASFFILRSRHQAVGFLFNLGYHNEVTQTKGFGFDEIDPLCGWAMSNERIKNMGYEVGQNCEVLRTGGRYPDQPIKIFITGGSTSDLALHTENWPRELQKQLAADSINATIYVGAVGGYTSGQELLKLMRDGMKIKPDIHISYTGANEASDSGYVSEYEQAFYEMGYRQNQTSTILPSTIFLLKSSLNLGYSGLKIKRVQPTDAYDFWRQNMNAMSGIADKNGYKFLGILQPVLGVGNYHQSNAKEIDPGGYSVSYQQFYPPSIEYIKKGNPKLYDLTNIFDTISGIVFIDDCHINTSYQSVVAANIMKILYDQSYIIRTRK